KWCSRSCCSVRRLWSGWIPGLAPGVSSPGARAVQAATRQASTARNERGGHFRGMTLRYSGLHDRTFFVTGANSGIGRALVEALVAGGGRVVLATRSEERTRPVLSAIQGRYPAAQPHWVSLDVSDLGSVRRAAQELARRLAGTRVTTYALHPGVVASNIWRALPLPLQWLGKLFMLSNEQGAESPLYCAIAPELAVTTGRYYDRMREVRPSPLADDAALAQELWARTEAAVGSAT